jgi:hypothetical protein
MADQTPNDTTKEKPTSAVTDDDDALVANDTDEQDDANETPIKSPSGTYLAPPSLTIRVPSTPTSSPSTSTTPSPRAPPPPRWRFVNDAKKSTGYDSSAAGTVVNGKSSEELGAKYVPPKISYEAKKKQEREVGRLDIDEHEEEGFTTCLKRAFRSLNGGVVSDSEEEDIGDIEVGDECAVVSDDDESKKDGTKEVTGDNDAREMNENKRRKACFLSLLLVVAVLGMILGVTLGNQNKQEKEIQTSGALALVDTSADNATRSPSPSQVALDVVSSLPPVGQSMVRPFFEGFCVVV